MLFLINQYKQYLSSTSVDVEKKEDKSKGFLITKKPVTAGQRNMVRVDKSHLDSEAMTSRKLKKARKKTGGRNNRGRTTAFHRGGGHKQMQFLIDYRRTVRDEAGMVTSINYSATHTAWVASVVTPSGKNYQILAPSGLEKYDWVNAGNDVSPSPGNAMPLKYIPQGYWVHNVESKPGQGGKFARAAGTKCQVRGIDPKTGDVTVKLASNEIRNFHSDCYATVGTVDNLYHHEENLGKAGVSRHLGRRPHVRGVAMNPVDHPHGGGEGKSTGGRPPVTPSGVLTKGKRTRNPRRKNRKILVPANKK